METDDSRSPADAACYYEKKHCYSLLCRQSVDNSYLCYSPLCRYRAVSKLKDVEKVETDIGRVSSVILTLVVSFGVLERKGNGEREGKSRSIYR